MNPSRSFSAKTRKPIAQKTWATPMGFYRPIETPARDTESIDSKEEDKHFMESASGPEHDHWHVERKHLVPILGPSAESKNQSPSKDDQALREKKHMTEGVQMTRHVIGNEKAAAPGTGCVMGTLDSSSLPFKKRKLESMMTPEIRSTLNTSVSVSSVLKTPTQYLRGIHPRCAFIRGVLPPAPSPKRRLVQPPHSTNATKGELGTRPNKRRIAANATVCQITVQQTPCKRKSNSPLAGGPSACKKRLSTFPSKQCQAPRIPSISTIQTTSSPITTIPCLNEQDIESVTSPQGHPVRLGQGDYGEVCLMRRGSDGSLLALKRLKRRSGNRRKAYREMMAEVRAMMAVQGLDSFPRFLGVVNQTSFAMEFLGDAGTYSATSVYSCMTDPDLLTPTQRLCVCVDVTRGLMSLHQAGWLHNDLHNGNVLICREPTSSGQIRAKIIDLGKACKIASPPPPNRFCKKTKAHFYSNCQQVAPEIVEGTCRCSPSSDVYSLGILLEDIAIDIQALEFVRSLARRCCHTEPSKRPDMATVLAELQRFQANATGSTPCR